jgi:hypothetical protein
MGRPLTGVFGGVCGMCGTAIPSWSTPWGVIAPSRGGDPPSPGGPRSLSQEQLGMLQAPMPELRFYQG